MAQPSHLTLINLPPPASNPDTPSEMPGTPTSTTTSLSALSTTAIKDGHRGHLPAGMSGRDRACLPSSNNNLEAERADRISRLAGLERVSTLRAPPQQQGGASSISPQTTPTSTSGFPPNFPPNFPQATNLTPAYFDAHGQPVAATKMSTVGTASATESYPGDDVRTTGGDQDEDMLSMDTNYREAGSVNSMGADADQMDEDLDALTSRSVAGYDDRMSDDGSASLVGFGEGAGSTVSGPIYHRRPIPGIPQGGPAGVYGLERSSSGLSDARSRDFGLGGDTPISAAAMQERREARMVDGVSNDGVGVPDEEMFVDTTNRGPVPVSQIHQFQNPHQQNQYPLAQPFQQTASVPTPVSREAVERMGRERLD